MAKAAETKNAVSPSPKTALPAHLQNRRQEVFGNTDNSDLIIPRVKLLQAISPELDTFNDAVKGEFWHTIAARSLGPTIRGIPILLQKSFVLWAPRNDDRGILARSNDGIHWDQPAGVEFEVKPKNSPHKVVYKLGATVHEKVDGNPALSEFGSSIPGNPNSPPAAALTYRFLWYFPDFADLSPAVIINTRSSVAPGKDLINKIKFRGIDSYGQMYQIGIRQEQGDEGPFFNYTYTSDGFASEEEYNICDDLYSRFREASWMASDENADVDKGSGDGGGNGTKKTGKVSDKF